MSFLLSLMVIASMPIYEIVWENDFIEIELHEAVEVYKYLPSATLTIDGETVHDPEMFYEVGVDRTFFSVVHSNTVKTHTVKYRVTFPSFGNRTSTRSVTFSIVDRIAPEVVFVPEFRIPVGEMIPDMMEGLVLTDNYDDASDLVITVDTASVMTDVAGCYPVTYTVLDSSLNRLVFVIEVIVFDAKPPRIIQKKDIVMQVQDVFSWSDYLTISDNEDRFVDVLVDDDMVDWRVPGDYQIMVVATDNAGLTTSVTLPITLYDGTKPELRVIGEVILSVGTELAMIDLYQYVIIVRDDVDDLKIHDVMIEHMIDPNVLGVYEILYSVSDKSGNQTTIKGEVHIVDDIKPMIELIGSLELSVGNPLPFWSTMFRITDNISASEEIKVTYDIKIDMEKTGIYPLVVVATDDVGNRRVFETYVLVVDCDQPSITQLEEIVITDFEPSALRSYFNLSDNYDTAEQLLFEVNDDHVDYETIGVYPVIILVSDTAGNQTELETIVYVMDLIPPIIDLRVNSLELEIHQPMPDIDALVNGVTDNGEPLTIDEIVIEGEVDVTKIGLYTLTMSIRDSSGNIGLETIDIMVNDTEDPVITMTDLTIRQGDQIDLLDGVKVEDRSGAVTLQIFPKTIDTSVAGLKTVMVVATDSRGNQSIRYRLIEVTPVATKRTMTDFLPMIVITTLGLSVLAYLQKTSGKRY
ncbi:MAG: DUF5011 domain-containing protein [Acholeplasmataceae bacterium]|nr:DUF5011 domain-containing protein [Acholeplasmataceae bacterium]